MPSSSDWKRDFAEHGVAIMPAPLPRDTCSRLIAEWDGSEWTAAPAIVGIVQQQADIIVARLPSGKRETDLVAERIAIGIATTLPELRAFQPNEVTLMRYGNAGSGLSAHFDNKRFLVAVVTISLAGSARIAVTLDREARVTTAEWIVHPGSIAVVRATPISSQADPRPLHLVQTLDAPRISMGLRMLSSQCGV